MRSACRLLAAGIVVALVAATTACAGARSGADDRVERARTLQIEVETLDRHLQRNADKLARTIEDAEHHGLTHQVERLEERRVLVLDAILDAERTATMRTELQAGQDHIQNQQHEPAIAAFESVRTTLHRLLDDFAAAEYLLLIEPVVVDLRQRWLAGDPATDDGLANEAEQGFRYAAELRAEGDLDGALHVYRMLLYDYQELLAAEG
ncbi:MAG: hypothetical protein FKY71_14455 [Spiribacter salinus]|uniref:Uncharacterized protein n=1 Tax=Spiribacter salinus TaxID=1335746 RepID=A0A540VNH9_9GAMM|nr:MAG: hypothetical protein FKY71_14455 [Spiribacter salinus]